MPAILFFSVFPTSAPRRSSQSKLFGKFNLGDLIENAAVSVVAKDAADEVVGFLAMYVTYTPYIYYTIHIYVVLAHSLPPFPPPATNQDAPSKNLSFSLQCICIFFSFTMYVQFISSHHCMHDHRAVCHQPDISPTKPHHATRSHQSSTKP